MVKKEKKSDIKPDGKLVDSDAIEAHPEFHEEYLDMADGFFRKEDPKFHELLMRIRGTKGEDRAPI